jgi:hypothetical protein
MSKIIFKYSHIFLLSGILVLSFLLSSRMILAGDFFYLFDQARDYLLTKEIIDTRNITLIGTHSGMGGFFHGPLWLYMLVPVFFLGGGDPFFFTYFYIFLTLLTVFIAYLVGLKLYGKNGGVIISFLVALSPVIWSSTPNFIGVNIVPMVFLGLFYFLVRYIRGDSKSFIFASFFTGLSLQFETALPLMLIPTMFVIFFLNKKARKNIKVIILSILAFLISITSFILFDLRHNFLMTGAVIKSFSQQVKAKDYLELSERIPSHLLSLYNVYKSILFREDLFFILLLSAIFIFATFLFVKKTNKYKREFFVLLLFPTITFIFFILYPYPIYPEYVHGLLIPIVLAFYLAITVLWKNITGKILVIIFFGITALNVLNYLQAQYLRDYIPNNTSGSYLNQKEMIDWIYKDAKKGTFGYFVYSPSIYTHGPDYMVGFQTKSYPQVKLENQKNKITYLILYPHMENDKGAYDFWKKNTLRTKGKVVTSKTFKGNITVEKLLIKENEPPVDPNYYQSLLFR